MWDQKDRRERVDQLDNGIEIIDFRDRLKNTLNTTCDPIKTESLNMQSDRIRSVYFSNKITFMLIAKFPQQ